jgi:hypothetical protein
MDENDSLNNENNIIDYSFYEKLIVIDDQKVGKSLLIQNLFPSIKMNFNSNCKK